MLKRMLLIAMLLFAPAGVHAANYTDVYYDTAEPGWGAFLVQSQTFQFIAFFIYGADGKPTWYTAQLNDDGTGNYTGTLYAITGTYFQNPWQGYNINPAGTASFTPSDVYHATLKYTVNGLAQVTKSMQRQTLTPDVLSPGPNYSGSMSGAVAGCADPTQNETPFRARYVLAVTQTANTSASLTFTFVDTAHDGLVCTISGPIAQYGRLYQLNGMLTCTGLGNGGNPHPAVIDAFHTTGQGIEGYLTGANGGGCNVSLHFAAVLNFNQ